MEKDKSKTKQMELGGLTPAQVTIRRCVLVLGLGRFLVCQLDRVGWLLLIWRR